MIQLPEAVRAMAARGPRWAAWVETLPGVVDQSMRQWALGPDGAATHGHCSVVLPVRTADGTAAVLKVGFPDEESEHEHLALRRWGGVGAVRLLGADPHHRALVLQRLARTDLTAVAQTSACEVVAGLYRSLHVPALPALRPLGFFIARWTAELAALPRRAPIPHRLVEQAVALGRDLMADRAVPDRVLHTDLHYGNVLADNHSGTGSDRGGEAPRWSAIDPKPVNGDPHYEIAPMLWNRWEDIAGDVREGVRRRFWTLVDAAGLDADRARDWVVVRMVHNAMWAVQDGPRTDREWLTRCVAVAKAVQD